MRAIAQWSYACQADAALLAEAEGSAPTEDAEFNPEYPYGFQGEWAPVVKDIVRLLKATPSSRPDVQVIE